MVSIDSSFIGSFKVGDNIHHNIDTLKLLYRHFNEGTEGEKQLLCKPIIVTLVSIGEAVLYDFHFRIVTFTKEGVNSLDEKVLKEIRSKKLDHFEKLITCAKKYNLFRVKNEKLYDRFDELRRLRNRIHIQNTKGEFERDESEAFSQKRKTQAEKVIEKVLRSMSTHYGRGSQLRGVSDFELPWESHF